jgi:NAD+ synthase (glutamine-hydrolysing)
MVRVALAQMNQVVGDISGNSERVAAAIERAHDEGAQVLVVPELAITGYPPEDLLLKKSFNAANVAALESVATKTSDVLTVIGFVDTDGALLYNAAAICFEGAVRAIYRKQLLPNYGVFDERRYFSPGTEHVLIDTPAGVLGVCVCEDAWSPSGPLVSQGDAGAQLILNINASPFHKNKLEERCAMLGDRAKRAKASIAYVNMVGGQDELVFDGGSVVVDPQGEVVSRFPQFVEHFVVVDVPLGEAHGGHGDNVRHLEFTLRDVGDAVASEVAEVLPDAMEIYEALKLALSDYVRKNGFEKVVIGLSGGIDSTLTAAIAADALGPDNVLGIAMPSEYSSSHSVDDAKQLAANLGIEMLEIPISGPFHAYTDVLRDAFGQVDPGVAEENLQARVRGNLLMATSNRYGHLVIATGNKSEMACGYATLYGDMAGGFALLKDVFKTEVYDLCTHRNQVSPVIPENVITKPPSAELRADQKDSDSLPPYDVLDPILEAYIEQDAGLEEIVALGYEADVVAKVTAMVDRSEYKRRQAAPGPKVTTKAFGRDRRLPITNRWTEGQ